MTHPNRCCGDCSNVVLTTCDKCNYKYPNNIEECPSCAIRREKKEKAMDTLSSLCTLESDMHESLVKEIKGFVDGLSDQQYIDYYAATLKTKKDMQYGQ